MQGHINTFDDALIEIARLQAEVERLRIERDDAVGEVQDIPHLFDLKSTAWNDAIEAAARAIESSAFDAEECYASEETVNAINGMAKLCRALRKDQP